MTTKTMLIIGFFVLAAAVVIPVVVFQGENTTKTVAVAGFLISVGKRNVSGKRNPRKVRKESKRQRGTGIGIRLVLNWELSSITKDRRHSIFNPSLATTSLATE